MKAKIASVLVMPMGLIVSCGTDADVKQTESHESQKAAKSRIEKIEKLKKLGIYTESRINSGSECDGGSRECYTR